MSIEDSKEIPNTQLEKVEGPAFNPVELLASNPARTTTPSDSQGILIAQEPLGKGELHNSPVPLPLDLNTLNGLRNLHDSLPDDSHTKDAIRRILETYRGFYSKD